LRTGDDNPIRRVRQEHQGCGVGERVGARVRGIFCAQEVGRKNVARLIGALAVNRQLERPGRVARYVSVKKAEREGYQLAGRVICGERGGGLESLAREVSESLVATFWMPQRGEHRDARGSRRRDQGAKHRAEDNRCFHDMRSILPGLEKTQEKIG